MPKFTLALRKAWRDPWVDLVILWVLGLAVEYVERRQRLSGGVSCIAIGGVSAVRHNTITRARDKGGSVPTSTRAAFVALIREAMMRFINVDEAPSIVGVSERHLGFYTV